ncbi:MAG: DnaB-like helicase C-terminal domain-containing protein [Mycolicibacterium fortuitum]
MRYVDSVQGHQPRLGDWLISGFTQASSIAMRTGFLTMPAVNQLETSMTTFLEQGGRLAIVAGGASDQVDLDALTKLTEIIRPHDGSWLRIVVHPEEFQNAKTYHLLFPDGHAEALVGSPNLTLGGMDSNHEAAVLLDSRNEAETQSVAEVLGGILAFRDRSGSLGLSDEIRMLLAGRRAVNARRGVQGAHRRLSPTLQLDELLTPAIDRADVIASVDGCAFLPTGFAVLDEVMGGLDRGTLTVIASRPGIGSSTLLLSFVRNAAIRNDRRTALFCLDRGSDDVVEHLLCAEARIRRQDIRRGRMSDSDWTRLANEMSRIQAAPLLLNTTPRPNLATLCEHITDLHRSEPLHLVAIDPMNMIDPALPPNSGREREVSTIARRLKLLALELEIPVVVTAEIGRGAEYRVDKRLTINDFRDSDTIAQVADNIILLHRPDAFDREDPRGGEADLHLAKHRNGPTVVVTVAHQLHIGRFTNMAR